VKSFSHFRDSRNIPSLRLLSPLVSETFSSRSFSSQRYFFISSLSFRRIEQSQKIETFSLHFSSIWELLLSFSRLRINDWLFRVRGQRKRYQPSPQANRDSFPRLAFYALSSHFSFFRRAEGSRASSHIERAAPSSALSEASRIDRQAASRDWDAASIF